MRARISPALFRQRTKSLWRTTPEDLENMKLYVAEREGDFDEEQRREIDRMLELNENRQNGNRRIHPVR
jgi:hypothetical protein